MNRPAAPPLDPTKAQAPVAVARYLAAVREAIDWTFGEGYAARPPELTAASIVQACTIEAAVNAGRILGRETNETLLKLKPRLFG